MFAPFHINTNTPWLALFHFAVILPSQTLSALCSWYDLSKHSPAMLFVFFFICEFFFEQLLVKPPCGFHWLPIELLCLRVGSYWNRFGFCRLHFKLLFVNFLLNPHIIYHLMQTCIPQRGWPSTLELFNYIFQPPITIVFALFGFNEDTPCNQICAVHSSLFLCVSSLFWNSVCLFADYPLGSFWCLLIPF